MNEIRTIQVVDAETGQPVVAVVRAAEGVVGICLSVADDGDVEVFFPLRDCRDLVAAVEEAMVLASSA